MKRLTAIITGRFQGVSYRYYTMREAKTLGVTGWVRNERDGSVKVVAEGDEQSLESLLRFLEEGPPAARVRSASASWSLATGEYATFEVHF